MRQLDEIHPQLRAEEPAAGPTSTIGTSVEQLDLATVLKVSQAVSGEIVLEKLLVTSCAPRSSRQAPSAAC